MGGIRRSGAPPVTRAALAGGDSMTKAGTVLGARHSVGVCESLEQPFESGHALTEVRQVAAHRPLTGHNESGECDSDSDNGDQLLAHGF